MKHTLQSIIYLNRSNFKLVSHLEDLVNEIVVLINLNFKMLLLINFIHLLFIRTNYNF